MSVLTLVRAKLKESTSRMPLRRCSACSRPSMRRARGNPLRVDQAGGRRDVPGPAGGRGRRGEPAARPAGGAGVLRSPPGVVRRAAGCRTGTPICTRLPTPSRQAEFQSQQATVHPRILGWTAFTPGVTMAAMATRILLLALLICAALPMAAKARPRVVVDAAITGRLVTYERTSLTVGQSGSRPAERCATRGCEPPGRRGRRPSVREPLPGHAQRASRLGQWPRRTTVSVTLLSR